MGNKFPDSFYYEDWFASVIQGEPIMDTLSTEHIEKAFLSIPESHRQHIEDYVNSLPTQHKRLVHDRYSDQVRQKMKEVREMLYAISLTNKS